MPKDHLSSLFHSFRKNAHYKNDDFEETTTSEAQKATENVCFAAAVSYQESVVNEVPPLRRDRHIAYIRNNLDQLGGGYSTLDASRPWLCYWGVHSINLLGEPISEELSSRIIRFLKTCVDDEGGYGGGPGQLGHLATTYAAVLCLASLGSEEALASIDRRRLYSFLRARHQSSGAYTMHVGGEAREEDLEGENQIVQEDMRAPYLALSVAALTRIIDSKLSDAVAEWIVSCQTYEGGFGGERGVEAHGGYTFCGYACLCLLNRARLADTQALHRWLSKRQMPFEGGFQGRTGKLVDGCYSFWQAAVFRLIDTELRREGAVPLGDAFDARALQEYILVCCQDERGGLRDKPGMRSDLYHSCYVLSGLAIAQSFVEDKALLFGGIQTQVEESHPVFNITLAREQSAREYFESKPL